MLPVIFLFLLFITDILAEEYCLSPGSLFFTEYCEGHCCGTFDTECCPDVFTVSEIIGIVIGSIIALCIVIALIVCLVHVCKKNKASTGRVVHPYPQTAMFVAGGPAPPAYGSQPPGPPPYSRGPAYPGPNPYPPAYPPQSQNSGNAFHPAQPPPGQLYGQPASNPTGPPPSGSPAPASAPAPAPAPNV